MSIVYFAQAGADGAVKIGRAVDVADRMRQLNVGVVDGMTVLRTVAGCKLAERWYHRHFSKLHQRAEWFEFHHDMLTVTAPCEVDLRVLFASQRKPQDEASRAVQQEVRDYMEMMRDMLPVGHSVLELVQKSAEVFGISPRRAKTYYYLGPCVPNAQEVDRIRQVMRSVLDERAGRLEQQAVQARAKADELAERVAMRRAKAPSVIRDVRQGALI